MLHVVHFGCFNHRTCTTYETCAKLHRFHMLYMPCGSKALRKMQNRNCMPTLLYQMKHMKTVLISMRMLWRCFFIASWQQHSSGSHREIYKWHLVHYRWHTAHFFMFHIKFCASHLKCCVFVLESHAFWGPSHLRYIIHTFWGTLHLQCIRFGVRCIYNVFDLRDAFTCKMYTFHGALHLHVCILGRVTLLYNVRVWSPLIFHNQASIDI